MSRGASVGNSHALGNGNSFALGPGTPPWARNWELQAARETSAAIWDFLE